MNKLWPKTTVEGLLGLGETESFFVSMASRMVVCRVEAKSGQSPAKPLDTVNEDRLKVIKNTGHVKVVVHNYCATR
jgi:hypothetical protein